MNELSLFSGAGGGLLGSKLLGWRCIGYVEWEEYCQKVLAQRIKDGFLDQAPIFGDIREFNTHWAERYRGVADVITAGFPCQPFSVAGKQAGEDDPRNMWPATLECIRLVRPRYCLLENVPGLLASGYLGTILGDLAEGGYNCRWRILSAAECGAPHKRDRLWIVANSVSTGCNAGGNGQAGEQGKTRGPVGAPGQRGLDRRPGVAGKQGLAAAASQRTEPAEQCGQRNGSQPSGEMAESDAERRNGRQDKQGEGSPGRGWPAESSPDVPDPDQGGRQRPRADSGEPDAGADRRDNPTGSGQISNANQFNDDYGRHGAGPLLGERSETPELSGREWWDIDPADLPDIAGGGCDQGAGLCQEEQAEHGRKRIAGDSAWSVESRVGRVVNGCPDRVDRLKALGNMQIPKVEATAWNLLTQEER